ncbi:hypothetical protein M0638_17215 [Roseomonas sp. NAR14]|uniref:Uncharacterized protein n=1 Tax=Roseomonas acroporae TaxID=2937791 RepID=A0A9X2BUZ9_9PROT|nr:hypothetical protein [Roseomonas acroporae]MCK8786117.1 hypothetical protein [Roseomonas acroporae]
MSDRRQRIAHIRIWPTDLGTWCGSTGSRQEWAFRCAEHAEALIERGWKRAPCPACVRAILAVDRAPFNQGVIYRTPGEGGAGGG